MVAKDGFRVSMDVHKSVLASKSRFFAEKLRKDRGVSHCVEISDCDDVEVYVESVVLMYCEDLKKRLMGEEVSRVLGLLKVCAFFVYLAFAFVLCFVFVLCVLGCWESLDEHIGYWVCTFEVSRKLGFVIVRGLFLWGFNQEREKRFCLGGL